MRPTFNSDAINSDTTNSDELGTSIADGREDSAADLPVARRPVS
jgi:hypothetical protein